MPTIKYPKNPNVDTAFVEQDDGTQNRALMIAPQDISTLELPNNPNSTKGYITVDGQKQRVILTADITGGGGGSSLPDQTGHSGEFLTTDGTDASWAAVDALPSQTGNSGKFLTTDGTDASWSDKPLVNNATGTNSVSVDLGHNTVTRTGATVYGAWGFSLGDYSTSVGFQSKAGPYSVSLGCNSYVQGSYSIAIGYLASTDYYNNAIMINASGTAQANRDANTFKVANANGNYEMMSADGTIPTARLTKVNTTVTLTSAGWSGGSQTVTVTGMTATGVVLVSPDPTDQSAYTSAGIICTAQAANSLTFTCTSTPSADIDVNVVML